ncbi:MAG: hypothetical protein HeimC2_22600 [Candidatus Heimdallarchaeota archaeon LC_2]|nr:MAG: hypothetical protein HeimC2_22600 [Candidatus Heimdallarchaeota archaeon LC_2]
MPPNDFSFEFENENYYSNQLINTLDLDEFDSKLISSLYREEQLTQDEYLILDFIGVNDLLRDGTLSISFQAMKRIISLHQARLTKAVNRLIAKDLLIKEKFGYTLTDEGITLFQRLHIQFQKFALKQPNDLFTHIAEGNVQGPSLQEFQYQEIENALIGKWFGKFRYTSKILNNNSLEIGWISTDGTLFASLKIGPGNELKINLSTYDLTIAQTEIQYLISHLSQILEASIDAPVVFNHFSIFDKNNQKIETDFAKIKFAG